VARYIFKSENEFFGGEFSRFDFYRATKPSAKTHLIEIVDEVRSTKHEALCNRIRSEKDKDERRRLKAQLPAVAFSGDFEQRNKAGLIKHSGFVCLDFDLVDNPQIDREAVRKDRHTLACFDSPSGGLKVVVEVSDQSDHSAAFEAARVYYSTQHSLNADESGKDVSRLCYLSHDPAAHFNYRAHAVKVRPKKPEPAREIERGEFTFEKVDSMLAAIRSKVGRPDYDEWLKIIAGTVDAIGEWHAHSLLVRHFPEETEGEYQDKMKHPLRDVTAGTLVHLAQDAGWHPERCEPKKSQLQRDYDGDLHSDSKVKEFAFTAERYSEIEEEHFILPDIAIHDIAYAASKILFSGASKSRKTWAMLLLSLCLQAGRDWWGFKTIAVPTLIIDLELQKSLLLSRIQWIAKAAGIPITRNLFVKSLRGQRVNFAEQKKALVQFCLSNGIKAIGIDPVYRIKTGEENSNDDIADFLLLIESVAHESDALVILTHHFAKGNSAVKSSIDRMSGAGTWARDPDVLISMTESKESDSDSPVFVIEPTLRDFAPVQPFAVRWEAPLWIRDNSASCTLKGAGRPEKDEDWLKKIPVGEDKAMRFDQLGTDVSKPTLERKIKGRDDVFVVKKTNSAGRSENHYYRVKLSSVSSYDKIKNNYERGEL